jgi:hypothetical protein
MRGSQIQFGSESRQSSFGSRLRTSQVINPHFPSLSFVASFLAAFGRLDPFDPRLMYLSLPFSIFWPVSIDGHEKGRRSESCAVAIAER